MYSIGWFHVKRDIKKNSQKTGEKNRVKSLILQNLYDFLASDSFFPNFTSLQLQLPCNSSRNLGQAHNHLPSMVQENQLNSSLHNTNSPSSSFIATTRWQRKMDTCGKNTTVTTEENANGKTYSSANISIQCKIPARVSLNPDEKR